MNPIRLQGLALVVIALGPAAACAQAQADARDSDRTAHTAQRLLEALQASSGVPGLGAAVWQDGNLRWQGQAGWRDVQQQAPVQADTRFRLASVSKVLAATAAARLAEQGRLSLDAPLPWHPFPPGHPGSAVTPRQLASHTSGLPHYQPFDGLRGRQAFADSRAAATHWLGERTLLAAPGQAYRYSSWGYTLLGAVIEHASGEPLAEHLRRHLTAGLDIAPDASPIDEPRATWAYEAGPAGWQVAGAHDYSYSLAGAGLMATPAALAQWGGRVLQGRVVQPSTWLEMTLPTRLADGSAVRDGVYGVGLGWRVQADDGGRAMWHHAGSAIGARSALLLQPPGPSGQRAMSVALLSNASWRSSIVESARTLAAVFENAPPIEGDVPCPRLGQRFEGQWGELRLTGQVEGGRTPGRPGAASPCEVRLRLDAAPALLRNDGPPQPRPELVLMALDGSPTLRWAALATPIGLFELQAKADGSLQGRVIASQGRLVFLP